jgi:Tfp pilus assembly protein PilN
MRALNLDYQDSGRKRLGGALLVAGLALLLGVGGYQYQLEQDIARLEAGTDRSSTAPASAGVTGSETQAQEIAQANSVIRRIALPWEDLFGAFEAVATGEVALLAIEPDAQKGRLRVTAEAKSSGAMLAYLDALQQQAMLQEVALASHEVQEDEPEKPLRFVLTARWNP